jgi:hypothetical protein
MSSKQVWMAAPDGDVFPTEYPETHKGCTRITAKEGRRRDKEQARVMLRGMFPPGSTVYTVLRHVSSSGMSRRIAVLFAEGGKVRDVSHLVARALEYKIHDRGGLIVGGCGMDMGFSVSYNLSSALWGDGYPCLGKGEDGRRVCPSNYHSNHRDSVRCEGVERDGERLHCYQPNGWNNRHEVPADWPRITIREGTEDAREITTLAACLFAPRNTPTEDGTTREVCPTCQGRGYLPNPDGPERFDLVHVDGYALRHEWV